MAQSGIWGQGRPGIYEISPEMRNCRGRRASDLAKGVGCVGQNPQSAMAQKRFDRQEFLPKILPALCRICIRYSNHNAGIRSRGAKAARRAEGNWLRINGSKCYDLAHFRRLGTWLCGRGRILTAPKHRGIPVSFLLPDGSAGIIDHPMKPMGEHVNEPSVYDDSCEDAYSRWRGERGWL